tara:strand:- start:137 stop:367 length:231 start_codon:yes stop_codon:yes gene_type:complete
MKDLIFEVDDYFGESYMKKYEVDMGNLKDRIMGVRNKVWSPWRDLTTESLDYYLMMIPDLMVKRNKLIHNGHSKQK